MMMVMMMVMRMMMVIIIIGGIWALAHIDSIYNMALPHWKASETLSSARSVDRMSSSIHRSWGGYRGRSPHPKTKLSEFY